MDKKAREILSSAYKATLMHREPGRYFAAHDEWQDNDVDCYVFRPVDDGTIYVVADQLFEDDARFIAACYNHVGALLEEVEPDCAESRKKQQLVEFDQQIFANVLDMGYDEDTAAAAIYEEQQACERIDAQTDQSVREYLITGA